MAPLLALLFTLSLSPQAGRAAEKVPTEKEVRASISRMLKTPEKAYNTDLTTVVRFADKSSLVQVDLVKGLLPVEEGARGQMLMGYHIAGAVQFDLDNPKLARDPVADKVAAVRATMIAYRTIQKARPAYKVKLLDELADIDKRGRLAAHVKSVMAASKK